MLPKTPLLTDRTTIVTDWKCQRKRWWYKDFGLTGIVPVDEAEALREGRYTHSDLAKVAEGKPLDVVLEEMGAAPLDNSLLLEPWLRRRGWLVAFYRYLWPLIQQDFEVAKSEWEIVLDRSPLWVAGTPDLVLRDRRDGRLIVVDYKSVGMVGKSWVTHWPYAVQMMLNAKAIEEELGEAPKYSLIIGMVKGQLKDGKLRHPYVWAYSDGTKWSADYVRGWDLRLLSEYPGGVEAWVAEQGEELGLAQFPISAPVFQNERLLEKLIEQRTRREKMIRLTRERAQTDEKLRDIIWPHNFEECTPSFGPPCPYREACHNAEIEADPIASGLYIVRTPHHDLELEGVDE